MGKLALGDLAPGDATVERPQASDFDQELLDLYDDYAHGRIDRRWFLNGAAKFAAAGVTAEALLQTLSPNYGWAQQVKPDDERIVTEYVEYASPKGGGKMKGYLAKPSQGQTPMPAVLVVHENRGLNPYIEDVARRLATAGFIALAPDALTPLGGYPGSDDEGRALQRQRNRDEMIEDFVAGTKWLSAHEATKPKVAVVGFCYGGGMANTLAVRLPEIVAAAVPYYGRQPDEEDVPRIKASLLIHYAELDRRINAGWPAYEKALKAAGVEHTAHLYPGVNHGFHNDTTPRFDQAAADLSWKRTVEFFKAKL